MIMISLKRRTAGDLLYKQILNAIQSFLLHRTEDSTGIKLVQAGSGREMDCISKCFSVL